MGRNEHIACGYSEFAPGCDDVLCLIHRIDRAVEKGWSVDSLQRRLDRRVDEFVVGTLTLAEATAEMADGLEPLGRHTSDNA